MSSNYSIENDNDQSFLENDPNQEIIDNDIESEEDEEEDEDSRHGLIVKYRTQPDINEMEYNKQIDNSSDSLNQESISGSNSSSSSSSNESSNEDDEDENDQQGKELTSQKPVDDEEDEEEEADDDDDIEGINVNSPKSDEPQKMETDSNMEEMSFQQQLEEQSSNDKQEDVQLKLNNNDQSKYDNQDDIIKNCDENNVYKWDDFIGVKVRLFTVEEYKQFQVPFTFGWKRELVLRCSGSSAEKRAGDVYYHTPDGRTKLRSYVELNQFLKRNPDITNVVPTNFTFAKQPIFRPPDEIVRHAMQRGANFVDRPFAFNQHIRTKHLPRQTNNCFSSGNNKSNNSLLDNSNNSELTSGILGRGKRKRVLPSRYDDKEIDLIPVKKSKQSNSTNLHSNQQRESFSNNNFNDSQSSQQIKSSTPMSTSKMSHQERRRVLQKQLIQKVGEEVMRQEEKERELAANNFNQSPSVPFKESRNNDQSLKLKIIKQNGNRKVDNQLSNNEILNLDAKNSNLQNNAANDDLIVDKQKPNNDQSEQNFRQPCSTYCPRRPNIVPNLLCARCLCLFHLKCVPEGVFLKDSKVFICPNCLLPEDRANAEDAEPESPISNNQSNKNSNSAKASNNDNLLMNSNFMDIQNSNPNSLLAKHQKHSNSNQKYSQLSYNNIEMSYNNNNFKKSYKWQPSHRQDSLTIMNGYHTKSNFIPNSFSYQTNVQNGYYNNQSKHHSYPRKINKYSGVSNMKIMPMSTSPQTSSPPPSNINFQPGMNHIYRLAQGVNGQPVVIKDKTQSLFTPTMGTNNYSSNNYLKHSNKLVNSDLRKASYCNGIMLANNTGNANVKMVQLINTGSKWFKYQQKRNNLLNRFDCMNNIILKLIEYLDYKDIINLRNTSKQWYQLMSTPAVWKYLRLRGLTISDWEKFGQYISSKNVKAINFINIRIPNNNQTKGINNTNSATTDSSSAIKTLTRNEKISNFWQQLSTINSYFCSVEILKFGTIPISAINKLLLHYKSGQASNLKLRQLILTNLFDETRPSDSCTMEFFSNILSVKNSLEHLQIDSKNGFTVSNAQSNEFETFLATLKQLTFLHTFSCTSFKNLSSDEYCKLFASLDSNKIRHLSIGSCSNWFNDSNDNGSSTLLMENIGKFSRILSLRLVDIHIISNSLPLVNLFESLIVVERLTFENITIYPSAKVTWTSLLAILKSLPLGELHLTSSEPFTNRMIFETIIELLLVQKRLVKIYWSVTSIINDFGHCYVPLSLDTFTCQNDFEGHMFIDQYFDFEQQLPENMLFQIVNASSQIGSSVSSNNQQENQSNNKNMILMEIDTLIEVIMKKVQYTSYAYGTPRTGSSLQIIPL